MEKEEKKLRYRHHYHFPIGILCIEEEEGFVVGVYREESFDPEKETETPLIRRAYEELEEYFSGQRRAFDIPVRQEGTEFQKKVWEALREIPYGETRSYGEIAGRIGHPKASRGVGGANHRNQVMILIPCHRVIGQDGSLVGFGGGVDMKKYLLELESGKSPQAVADGLRCDGLEDGR